MACAWRLVGTVITTLAVLATFPAAALAALPHSAADMEAAHGPDAIKIKDDLLAPIASLTVIARADYANEVIKEFEGELKSANPDARLNTAILFGGLESLVCDRVYEMMLTSPDPALRLWGAKGLAAIAPDIKRVGGATLSRATTALKNADSTEPSPVVKSQVESALSLF